MAVNLFSGEYHYYPSLEMLAYEQTLRLDTFGEGDGNCICCGRLYGRVKAYRYNQKLYVEVGVRDDDDLDYYCSIIVDNEDTQRRLFHNAIDVLRDYSYYKIWNALEFFEDHLLKSVDKIFLEKGEY